MEFTDSRATTRTSEVLQRIVTVARATCSCATTTTLRIWATATKTSGFLFVASKTNKVNVAADRLWADMTEPQVLCYGVAQRLN